MQGKYGPDALSFKDASVPVPVSWVEVRAIYALSLSLQNARASRDNVKGVLRSKNTDLERARRDIVDHDLLQNRSVVALLVEVQRFFDGADMTEREMYDLKKRVGALVARARKQDRRKNHF
jgi:hypothetical protein